MKQLFSLTLVALIQLAGSHAHAEAVLYTGPAGGDWADAQVWGDGISYPAREDYAVLQNTAYLNRAVPNDVFAVRIGAGGVGVLNVGKGASLSATVHSNWDSHVGSGKGGHGTLNQSGGSVILNYLEVGRSDSSHGNVLLTGGELFISRGRGGYSVYLGTDDTKKMTGGIGSILVSGGTFITRTGVYLGTPDGVGVGSFCVIGSGAEQIGIGARNNGDGTWVQNPGSTLKAQVDSGGITPIFIEEDSGATQATFESGALLDVEYGAGASKGGSWVLMEVENGVVEDKGLAFAAGVDTHIWSFRIDNSGKNGILYISAVETPLGLVL